MLQRSLILALGITGVLGHVGIGKNTACVVLQPTVSLLMSTACLPRYEAGFTFPFEQRSYRLVSRAVLQALCLRRDTTYMRKTHRTVGIGRARWSAPADSLMFRTTAHGIETTPSTICVGEGMSLESAARLIFKIDAHTTARRCAH